MPARLRINVFTPLPPSRTEIANVNIPVLSLLAEHAEVTVWTPQDHWDPLPDPRIDVHAFRSDAIDFWNIQGADAHLFHLGNNIEMHQDIFDICRRSPGLVVLHDTNLHGFLLELYAQGRHATYFEALGRCHGRGAVEEARRALRQGEPPEALIERWPCTLAPCARATGILLHDPVFAETLRGLTDLPVFYLALPFSGLAWPAPAMPGPLMTPPYRLVMFGFLSTNRRVESVLQALAASPLRGMFQLDIYGIHHDPAALDRLRRDLGLQDIVAVHGFVAQDALDRAIGQADLAINLRYPSRGEASATQLRIWANGAASAVTQTGWYATLPDACCHFVSPIDEAADLQHLLVDLCCNPERYRRMARAGRAHVMRAHDPSRYVAGLLEILKEEPQRRRRSLVRGIGRTPAGRPSDHPHSELLLSRAAAALRSDPSDAVSTSPSSRLNSPIGSAEGAALPPA